jgi:hypothetical protein
MVWNKVVFKNNNLNANQKHNTQKIQKFKMYAISKKRGGRGGRREVTKRMTAFEIIQSSVVAIIYILIYLVVCP